MTGHALRALVVLLSVACGPQPEQGDQPARRDQLEQGEPLDQARSGLPAHTQGLALEPSPWSSAGFDAQPRLAELQRRIPPELGYEPATTRWRTARLELPDAIRNRLAASPDELLAALATHLAGDGALGRDVWERTMRVWIDDERAVGVVLQWGLKDDSVAGHDLRVHMRRGDGGWRVERVEERFHCARGVTGERRCL